LFIPPTEGVDWKLVYEFCIAGVEEEVESEFALSSTVVPSGFFFAAINARRNTEYKAGVWS
jgi:hypothetical protein